MFVAVSSVSAGGGRVCVKRRSSPADDDHDGGGDDGVCVDSSIVSRHFVDIIYCRGGREGDGHGDCGEHTHTHTHDCLARPLGTDVYRLSASL